MKPSKIGQKWWKSWILWLILAQRRTYLAKNVASIGWNISNIIRLKGQIRWWGTFKALGATYFWVKLWLPTTLEGPGAINMARKNLAPKNLSAWKPQIEISNRLQESVFIYFPYLRLQKRQKVTQQQKKVVAGKILPYGIFNNSA